MGLPEDGGGAIAPLGLGVLVNERTAQPKTVAFGNAYDLVRIEPGVVFEPNQKIVVRFQQDREGVHGVALPQRHDRDRQEETEMVPDPFSPDP